MLIAVNGTAMRDLELNGTLLDADATFVREARTKPCYRLWSIANQYPGMVRVNHGGGQIELELWEVARTELAGILEKEPPGLTIGWIELEDGEKVLGILAEPYILEEQTEITHFGGWRAFISSKQFKE